MAYYNYINLIYDSTYDRVLQAELQAQHLRRRTIQEEASIINRLRRSRIQAEIQANRAATQMFLKRSRAQQEVAEQCIKKQQQVSAEMALTESMLSRSRRQKLCQQSERQLQRSRDESQRLQRSAINEQTMDMTAIIRPETDRSDINQRRRVVEQDVSRILTTY